MTARLIALVALLGVAGAVAAVVLLNPGAPCEQIDFATWRSDVTTRAEMAQHVESCDSLLGRKRMEVRGLLGRPDDVDDRADHWTAALDVTYDRRDQVAGVEVVGEYADAD